MNNGQLNIVSVPTVTQLVTLEPTVPVAVTMNDAQQNGGDFAELLSGIQLQAKEKDLPDSGQAEQLPDGICMHQFSLDASLDEPAVDLLAQLNVSSRITSASDLSEQKTEDAEKTDVSADAVPLDSVPSEVTSQMVLAAYSQPGRMPEVNILTQVPVDRLQNVATALEHPATTSAPPVEKQAEHVTAEPLSATTVRSAEEQAMRPAALSVQEHAGPLLPSDVPLTVPTAVPQPAKSDRMSDVNISTQLPVDRLQNVTTVTDQPAIFSASPDKIKVEQPIAEPVQKIPVQAPVSLSATDATIPAPDEPIVPLGTKTVDLHAIPAEKTAAVSMAPKSELPTAHLAATVPATSPESEIEIHLSQPQPITAQVTAASVLADNRSTAVAQELRGARQRLNPEQQIEKVRTGSEQSVVKEMASSLQAAASAGESSLDSDSSHGSDNNQALAQNMSGQLKTEHPGATAPSAKAVQADPARQEIPEQVMHQVKERLVQHDLKPGSQQITLTLSPDSLGELKMNLNLQGQKLSVEIVTENRAVRDAIVQHSDALKESLARQNITMESFDVTTGGKGTGSQGQNQNAWRELAKQQQQQFWTSPRGYQTAQADLPSGQEVCQRQQGQSMLDIHY